MMLLYHLPRLSSPFSVSISKKLTRRTFPFFLSTLSSNPTSTLSPTSLASASNRTSPVTSLSQLSQIEITRKSVFFDDDQVEFDPDSEVPEETQIEIPFEKLFIPPGVEVSGDKSALSRRVLKGSNIVLSDYAAHAQISEAEFVKSSKRTADCPSDGLPEFALVGRSNVGKSSLLNSLVRRKRLALTSKKPGKTQCINHFKVNGSWYLVDLPGYGYAAAPHEVRIDWDQFTKDYFLNRETLVSVFLLIDASIPAKKIDLEYVSWLGQNQIPMTLVFTKCDKRKKKRKGGKRPDENVEDFQNLVREFFRAAPPWVMTSSITNMGREEILLHMAQLRNYWLKH